MVTKHNVNEGYVKGKNVRHSHYDYSDRMHNMQKKIIGKGRRLIYRTNINVPALNYTTGRDVLRLLREVAQLERERKNETVP
jgi:hypothetical protein